MPIAGRLLGATALGAALGLVAVACAAGGASGIDPSSTAASASGPPARATVKVVAGGYVYLRVPAEPDASQRLLLERKRADRWVEQQEVSAPRADVGTTIAVPPGRYRVRAVGSGRGGETAVIPVGRVKDHRPTAKSLHPKPAAAYADQPSSYRDACHAAVAEQKARLCTYGDPTSRDAVLMLGDSQLAQWLGAADAAARAAGLRIDYATKSSCPASDATVGVEEPVRAYRECDRWRSDLFDSLMRGGVEYRLALVGDFEGYDLFERSTGQPLAGSAADKEWAQAATRTADILVGRAKRVIWIRAIADLVIDPPTCLTKHPRHISDCDRFSDRAPGGADPRWDAKAAALAAFPTVGLADLAAQVCPFGVCTVNRGRVLKYRDRYHITDTFSSRLAPQLRRILSRES